MSNLGKDLQQLKRTFDVNVNHFLDQYRDKFGKNIGIKSKLEVENDVHRVFFELTNIPMSRSRKEQRKNINVFIYGFLAGQRISDICGYGTRISYVEIQTNEYQYLEGFHFDYRESLDTPIQGGHPIFHLQLDKKAASKYVDKVLIGNTQGEEHPYTLEHIRVPSAQMDAFSCVLMVIADHLYDGLIKDEFRKLVHAVHDLMPNVDLAQHDQTTRTIFTNKTVASGWYFASFGI